MNETTISAIPLAEEPPVVLLVATPLAALVLPKPSPPRSLFVRIMTGIAFTWEIVFGLVSLLLALAILAAIPVLQFLTLGYLLEVSGRIGRSGRLRDGFIGIRASARVGSIFLGSAIVLLPLRLIAYFARSAELIEPEGSIAKGWRIALTTLTILAGLHIALACSRGGKLRHFLWPFGNPFWLIGRLWRGGYLREARDGVWDFVVSLRLPYYFWLGLRGFLGGFLWLVGPITLLAMSRQFPLLGLLGGLLFVLVVLYVPFMQTHFAVENRFVAWFEWGEVRRLYQNAPWAFAFSFLIMLAFALPLYLLKIEMVPREAAWLPSLVFILFMVPARFLIGWGYGRARKRANPRHWFFRWTTRIAMLAVAMTYGIVVYFTQFITWGGIWSLYEQHAFLLPVPFFSM